MLFDATEGDTTECQLFSAQSGKQMGKKRSEEAEGSLLKLFARGPGRPQKENSPAVATSLRAAMRFLVNFIRSAE